MISSGPVPDDADRPSAPVVRLPGRARRPRLPDPFTAPRSAGEAVTTALVALSGMDDDALAVRLAEPDMPAITAGVVARWRSSAALPDVMAMLKLMALAGPAGVDLLYGLPFTG